MRTYWGYLDLHSALCRIALSGDVHPNPGPSDVRPSRVTTATRRTSRADSGTRKTEWATGRAGHTPPIKVLQSNVGSLKGNWVEIRALLASEKPDIVLLQETQLRPVQVVKFEGYHTCRRDRKTARGISEAVKGGGVATLISTRRKGLSFTELEELPLGPDNTTEILRVLVRIGSFSLLIANVYVPPIKSCRDDNRTQHFNPHRSLTQCLDSSGGGSLIAGDFNAHDIMWDEWAQETPMGNDIAEWTTSTGVKIWNSGEPTFYSGGKKSVPDITMTTSDWKVEEWRLLDAIGRSGHKLISYNMTKNIGGDLGSIERVVARKTKIQWNKVNWVDYNSQVEKEFEVKKKDLIQNDQWGNPGKRIWALTSAWMEASKKLRQGCRKDPIHSMSPELEQLFQTRNKARLDAEKTNKEDDWKTWMRIAKDTQELLNANRRESWREYCNSLSYREDPRKVSNIIKAINREPRPPQNKSITSASGKTIHTDKGKCKAFRSMFSAISKRPHLCKGRLQRAVARRVKVENCNYMRYVITIAGMTVTGTSP